MQPEYTRPLESQQSVSLPAAPLGRPRRAWTAMPEGNELPNLRKARHDGRLDPVAQRLECIEDPGEVTLAQDEFFLNKASAD